MQGLDQAAIWVMPATGTSDPTLVSRNVMGNEAEPAWSPDGKWIAFAGDGGIYKIKLDGTGLKQLTKPGTSSDDNPAWSPDGKQLAFMRWHEGDPPVYKTPQLWTMKADGTGAKQLTTTSKNLAPEWSPDGKKIAFVSTRKPKGSVFTIDLATGHVARLVNGTNDVSRISWVTTSS